jgi:hypothetical protein
VQPPTTQPTTTSAPPVTSSHPTKHT